MRILVVINSLNAGGAEKLVLDSLPLIKAKGNEVHLLLLTANETPFLSKLERAGHIKTHKISAGSLYNPLLILRIRKLLSKFDLVHVHLFPALYWTAIASRLSIRKPILVFTEHNTSNRRRNIFFKILDRFIYSSYSSIVVISNEVKQQLKKHIGGRDERFTLIPNGIDLESFNRASPAKLIFETSDSVIITMVASFTSQKDQDTLIRALTYLENTFKLVLVGDGPRRNECEQLARNLKLEERVEFVGIREDVPSILKASSVIVLSSYYEGVSLSAIEGMASGRPFIGADVPGLKNMVEGYGLLFPQGDSEILASLIKELSQNSEKYNQVADRCMERASDYNLTKNVDSHIALYQSLLPKND